MCDPKMSRSKNRRTKAMSRRKMRPSRPPTTPACDDGEKDDGLKSFSDRLVMKLAAHRTPTLRNTLAQDPQAAFLATLHAMTLRLFYRYSIDSCVKIEPHNAAFGAQVPGLGDTAYAQAIYQCHETWTRNLPKVPEDLWEPLTEFDSRSRDGIFAHCVFCGATYSLYSVRF